MKTALKVLAAAALVTLSGSTFAAADPGATTAPRNGAITFFISGRDTGIEAIASNGSNRRVLTSFAGCKPTTSPWSICTIDALAWSSTGTRLAYVVGHRGHSDEPARLYVQDAEGGSRRLLMSCSDGCADPSWSPDGTRLAMQTTRGLTIVDVRTAHRRLIANARKLWLSATWSPDGRAIAFVDDAIYTVAPDGSALTRLRGTRGGVLPTWSPDGHSLAFAKQKGLFVTSLVRSGPTLVRVVPNGADTPRWSPDGNQLMYAATPGRSGAFGGEIWVVDVDGTHARRIYRQECCIDYGPDAVWSPDGRQVAISAAGSFFVARSDGSRVRRLASGVIATGSAGFPLLAWQPHPSPIRSLAGAGFGVHTSLDGKRALPHRVRWRATASRPVLRVEFFIDGGKARWVAHEAPYTYAEDGYLVTSFLKPGRHRFTVRATGYDGAVATASTVARVAAAPLPPAALAGRWQRTVDSAGAPAPPTGAFDPTLTPSGTYTLTFERRWIRDDFPGTFVYPASNHTGNGLVFLSDYLPGPRRFHVQGEVVFHPLRYDEAEGGAWCAFGGPGADYTWTATGNTLQLEPSGGADPCAIRGFVWSGTWTRVG
jgi:dipeptidyl aminopeptidase/acylaminoacyl peptidase